MIASGDIKKGQVVILSDLESIVTAIKMSRIFVADRDYKDGEEVNPEDLKVHYVVSVKEKEE